MIDIVNVTQHYGVRPVLRDVNLRIERGELVALLGPNGMGKTTLLAVVAGVLAPQKGYVEINGWRRRRTESEELAIRRVVVYLPDHPWLPKNRTGREFLLGVGRLYDVDDERLMRHVDSLLDLFDLRTEADWPIRSYSNGQQHKVALCSALVTEAPVLLLDEPFSGGLDPAGILALERVLKHLTRQLELTVVMSTPVPELVEELADRVVILREGRIAAADTIENLRRQVECAGPLSEVLGRLVHPQSVEKLERYLEERRR
ncbi:MAG TPA: ABC transporter ATP-binding protein [Planctomycetaceae bacterium]|nr:ABC transporter ATP-binding protein [Planctomycetaceae bacterium]